MMRSRTAGVAALALSALWHVAHVFTLLAVAALAFIGHVITIDQRELASLASDYGPPHGHFVLARQDKALIGCGGLRRVSDGVCEMKRPYVVPAHRGRRVGRAIAESLIAYARGAGYQTMVLDTLPFMSRALHDDG